MGPGCGLECEAGKIDGKIHQLVKNLKGDILSDVELWQSPSGAFSQD